MRLTCQGCGAPLDVPDPVAERFLRCRFCGALSAVPRSASAALPRTDADTAPRGPIAVPPGVQIVESPARLEIVRRWFHWTGVVLAAFSVFWLGLLAAMYGVMGSAGAPAFVFLFPLLHVAVGVALAYYAAALLLNRTTVEVGHRTLRVRHGPVPWRGVRALPASAIAQVFAREDAHRQKDGGTSHTYSVHAVTKDGRRVKLLGAVLEPDHALFVEQRIERHLGLVDRAVEGELARG